jgi:hypothetical protein
MRKEFSPRMRTTNSHMSVRATLKSIPAEGSRTFLDFLRKWPGTHDSAVWKMFLAGGAVASVAPAATAFVHRKALMLTTVDFDWAAEEDEATVARNEAWLEEFHAAMQHVHLGPEQPEFH